MQIETPKGAATRPTTDRVKESLFNIIHQLMEGSVVLDLFSGSGSLGIEALSRGAKMSVFCDKDLGTTQLIKRNLKHCKLEAHSVVLCCDFKQAVKKISTQRADYDKPDIVFLDPPYDTGLLQEALNKIIEADILTKGAIIVAEHAKNDVVLKEEALQKEYLVVREEKYGDTLISFIKRTVDV